MSTSFIKINILLLSALIQSLRKNTLCKIFHLIRFYYFFLQTASDGSRVEQKRTKKKKFLFLSEQTFFVKSVDNHNILCYSLIKNTSRLLCVPFLGLIFDIFRTFVLTNKNLCCTIQSQQQNKCSIKYLTQKGIKNYVTCTFINNYR